MQMKRGSRGLLGHGEDTDSYRSRSIIPRQEYQISVGCCVASWNEVLIPRGGGTPI